MTEMKTPDLINDDSKKQAGLTKAESKEWNRFHDRVIGYVDKGIMFKLLESKIDSNRVMGEEDIRKYELSGGVMSRLADGRRLEAYMTCEYEGRDDHGKELLAEARAFIDFAWRARARHPKPPRGFRKKYEFAGDRKKKKIEEKKAERVEDDDDNNNANNKKSAEDKKIERKKGIKEEDGKPAAPETLPSPGDCLTSSSASPLGEMLPFCDMPGAGVSGADGDASTAGGREDAPATHPNNRIIPPNGDVIRIEDDHIIIDGIREEYDGADYNLVEDALRRMRDNYGATYAEYSDADAKNDVNYSSNINARTQDLYQFERITGAGKRCVAGISSHCPAGDDASVREAMCERANFFLDKIASRPGGMPRDTRGDEMPSTGNGNASAGGEAHPSASGGAIPAKVATAPKITDFNEVWGDGDKEDANDKQTPIIIPAAPAGGNSQPAASAPMTGGAGAGVAVAGDNGGGGDDDDDDNVSNAAGNDEIITLFGHDLPKPPDDFTLDDREKANEEKYGTNEERFALYPRKWVKIRPADRGKKLSTSDMGQPKVLQEDLRDKVGKGGGYTVTPAFNNPTNSRIRNLVIFDIDCDIEENPEIKRIVERMAYAGWFQILTPSRRGVQFMLYGITDFNGKQKIHGKSSNGRPIEIEILGYKQHGMGVGSLVDQDPDKPKMKRPGKPYANIGGGSLPDAKGMSYRDAIADFCRVLGWNDSFAESFKPRPVEILDKTDTNDGANPEGVFKVRKKQPDWVVIPSDEVGSGGNGGAGSSGIIPMADLIEYRQLPDGERYEGYHKQVAKYLNEKKSQGLSDEEAALLCDNHLRPIYTGINMGGDPLSVGVYEERIVRNSIPNALKDWHKKHKDENKNNAKKAKEDSDSRKKSDADRGDIPSESDIAKWGVGGSPEARRTSIEPEAWKTKASQYYDTKPGFHRPIPIETDIRMPFIEEKFQPTEKEIKENGGSTDPIWKEVAPSHIDMANAIHSAMPCITIRGMPGKRKLYVMKNLQWVDAEDRVSEIIQRMLGPASTSKRKSEILNHLTDIESHDIEEFDTKTEIICARNGFYDAKERRMLGYDEAVNYMSLSQIPHDIPEDLGESDKLDDIIAGIVVSRVVPDTEAERIRSIKVRQVREFMGAILGHTRYQNHRYCLMFHGDTNTGKSTIANMIKKIVGEGNTSSVGFKLLVGNNFAGSQIWDKMVNISTETGAEKVDDITKFKEFISFDDSVFVESKGVDGISVVPRCNFVFCMNEVPMVPGGGANAFYDRIIFMECDNMFERNADIDNIMNDSAESSRILMSFINSFSDFIGNGYKLTELPRLEDTKRAMICRSHPLIRFISNHTLRGFKMNEKQRELYRDVRIMEDDVYKEMVRAYLSDIGSNENIRDRDIVNHTQGYGNYTRRRTTRNSEKSDDLKENLYVWDDLFIKRWEGLGFKRMLEKYPQFFPSQKNETL